MAVNINRVVLTGNLTADPEMRETGGGTPICSLRVAVNGRRKQGEEWVDKPNYFNVTVFGRSAQTAHQYLSKGSPVAVDGRLDWREWADKETGAKRSAVEIIADTVQFLGSGGQRDGGGNGGGYQPRSDVPTDVSDFARQPDRTPVPDRGAPTADDDIPF